jgi:sulfhydrogenase subunit beta (sulfur reductase)
MARLEGFLARSLLHELIAALGAGGRRVIGPQVRDGAVVYEPLESEAQLPHGLHDVQAPGRYRLEQADTPRCFAWADGPQALKPLVFTPRERLWTSERAEDGALRFRESAESVEPTAVLGVRACDLAALALQDQHFLEGTFPDPSYRARRESLFLVAVHCTHPADTCFCASTGDGPRAEAGFDVALHELDDGFIVSSGSPAGHAFCGMLALSEAEEDLCANAEAEVERAAAGQQRSLPGQDLRTPLMQRLEHPRWAEVAERCLSCGNCTAVCPTCFCHAEVELPDIDGRSSDHYRQWDSCFTEGHSRLSGFVVRPDTRTRYRQWLVHKLATWHDQYGRSGCVGCGRCVTWCPVGIDITEEAHALCADPT